VQKIEQSGPTSTYVYDAMGQLAAEYDTGSSTASGTQYLTADYLGSTRMLTDTSGNFVACHDYQPFGAEIPVGINGRGTCYAGIDNPKQKFTGKERDAETGLDYFGARYFSGAQGRYTSPDWNKVPQAIPYANLKDPRTLNLYVYVRNSPVSFTDSDGHNIDCTGENAQGAGCQAIARWYADHGIDPGETATAFDVVKNKKGQVIGVTYTYADGSKMTFKGVWAFIDNNPGNAIAGGTLGRNGAFTIFASAQAGWDAIDNNLDWHAKAGHDILKTMEAYAPKCEEPCKNPLLRGNDPEKYARDLAAEIGVQTTTKLADLSRGQLNDVVVTIGRIEGYFDKINSASTAEKK
jgi:RHS repeat-associated protein